MSTQPLDVSQTLKFNNVGTVVKAEIHGDKIVAPFKLSGVAWLINNDQLTSLVSLYPLDYSGAPDTAPVEKTFSAIERRVGDMLDHAFEIPDRESTSWVAVRKDLLASVMNSGVSQAKACVTVTAESPKQTVSDKIKLPNGLGISCVSSRDCTPNRQCSFDASHDTRDCSTCLVPSPRICTWTPWGTKCVGGGGCVTKGNDPICETAKAAQNLVYIADANLRKADCDRLRETERATCDIEKVGERTLCETKKLRLTSIAATGNFANVDTETQFKTNGLKVCLRDFTLSSNFDKVQFALDVSGEASADIGVKFTPLDIVGHLTCLFPWNKSQTFKASLRDSRLLISSDITLVTEGEEARADFAIAALPVKARLQPSPTEYLLNNPEMILSCPIASGIQPLTLGLAPFVKRVARRN